MSSAYLRLLIFLPAILIPACASSSPAFLIMYSAYKLNKQGDNIQPWRTSGRVWMWELDCEESWVPKNWCFWTVMLEKTLENPLDCKESQPVHSKRDQSWVFFGRTDAKAETPILWPPHAKSWLIGKDSDAEGEGDDRGWDGWMTSPTQWTWVWVTSGSWWWTGRPGVLRFMGSQRVGHNWVTELNCTDIIEEKNLSSRRVCVCVCVCVYKV